MAFSHPFISKAVNELKCLRTGAGSVAAERPDGQQSPTQQPHEASQQQSNKGQHATGVAHTQESVHQQKGESTGQKQNNNSKNKEGNFSNGSGTGSAQPLEKKTDEASKAPHSARSNQSDGVNVHASLPKISNRQ